MPAEDDAISPSKPIKTAAAGGAGGSLGLFGIYLFLQNQVNEADWKVSKGDLRLILTVAIVMAVLALLLTFLDGLQRWLLLWRAMDKSNGEKLINALKGVVSNPLARYALIDTHQLLGQGQESEEPGGETVE